VRSTAGHLSLLPIQSILARYAHSRMDKRMEAQAKMIEAMGLNEETARQLIQ
jgi:hypothetical protein